MAKILVVDDHPQIVRLLQRVLQTDAHEVLTAADGGEALELIGREHPALVLLDVNLPVKNGFQVLAELKDDPAARSIPVIMLTAHDQDTEIESAMKLGADWFLPKPFHPAEVLALARRFLADGVVKDRDQC